MASDASGSGGCFVIAKRLTSLGTRQAMMDPPREAAHSGVVVFDFFAGIGGLLRALDRLGFKWEHHVTSESDKDCR